MSTYCVLGTRPGTNRQLAVQAQRSAHRSPHLLQQCSFSDHRSPRLPRSLQGTAAFPPVSPKSHHPGFTALSTALRRLPPAEWKRFLSHGEQISDPASLDKEELKGKSRRVEACPGQQARRLPTAFRLCPTQTKGPMATARHEEGWDVGDERHQ